VEIPASPESTSEGEPEPEEREHRRWFGARESAPVETPEGEIEPEPKAEPKEHRRWLGIREDKAAEPLDEAELAADEIQIAPEIRRHFHLLRQEPEGETDAVLEHTMGIPAPPETDLVAETEAEAVPEDTVDIQAPPESGAEAEAEADQEHTLDIPAPPEKAAEAEPEAEQKVRRRWFGLQASEPAEPAVEPDIEAETGTEAEKTSPTPKPKPWSSEPVVPIAESEEERARTERRRRRAARRAGEPLEPEPSASRRRVTRRSKTGRDGEMEGRPVNEPSTEAMPELGDPTGETERKNAAATAGTKRSIRGIRRRLRSGARAKIDTPERAGGYVVGLHDEPQEVEEEAPTELGAAAPGGEMTVEIELPSEVPVGEIERTLSELGARKPRQPKRRWRFGVDAEDEDPRRTADAEELDDALRQDRELRLAAERERRRREREYQRTLRDRVK
jgi:hypothetical protein